MNEIREEIKKASSEILQKAMTEDLIIELATILNRHLLQEMNNKFQKVIPIIIGELKAQITREIKAQMTNEIKELVRQETKNHLMKDPKTPTIKKEDEEIQPEEMENASQEIKKKNNGNC